MDCEVISADTSASYSDVLTRELLFHINNIMNKILQLECIVLYLLSTHKPINNFLMQNVLKLILNSFYEEFYLLFEVI